MANILVKTTKGYDLTKFVFDLGKLTDPVKDLKKIDDNTASVKIGLGYTLVIDGDFNANQSKGEVEKISVFHGNDHLFDIQKVDYSLLALLIVGQEGAGKMLSVFFGDGAYVFGNKGEDVLISLGTARFFGGAKDDQLFDTNGNANHFDGETGADTVVYLSNPDIPGVTVNLADASQNKGEAAGDTYRSIENAVGTSFDDILIGDKKKNAFLGMEGNDIFVGGAGKDGFNGGAGIDLASYETSAVGVTVHMTLMSRNTGDAEGDIYQSIEGIIGSAHKDDLTGDTKDNVIYGGREDDRIDGGGGNDELWGDSEEFGVDGADTFVFTGPSATDLKRIMDFDVMDHVELSRTGFGLHPAYQLTVGSTLIIAHASPTATTNSPTFLVEQSTGNLYFDADGNGSGVKELIANVQFHSQQYLDLNDFVIV